MKLKGKEFLWKGAVEGQTHVERLSTPMSMQGEGGGREGSQELKPEQTGLISYQAATIMTCKFRELTAWSKRKHGPLHPSFHAAGGRTAEWLRARSLKTLVVDCLPLTFHSLIREMAK